MGAKMFLQQPDKAEGSEESRHAFYQLSTVVIAADDQRPAAAGVSWGMHSGMMSYHRHLRRGAAADLIATEAQRWSSRWELWLPIMF